MHNKKTLFGPNFGEYLDRILANFGEFWSRYKPHLITFEKYLKNCFNFNAKPDFKVFKMMIYASKTMNFVFKMMECVLMMMIMMMNFALKMMNLWIKNDGRLHQK